MISPSAISGRRGCARTAKCAGLFAAAALAAAALLLDPSGSAPARAETRGQADTIKVVTHEIEPFVMIDDDGQLRGFSVDVWDEVAAATGVTYEWQVADTVGEQLEAIAEGDADVAIAAISVTSDREKLVDFSHAYFRSGLRVLTVASSARIAGPLLDVLLSRRLLLAYAFLLLLLAAVGLAAWLVERDRNNMFPRAVGPGVWDGIWWAAATMTTVGYGDRTMTGRAGRVLGLVWMFVGMFVFANLAAVIASELTVARQTTAVAGVHDLADARVATVTGTTSSDFLDEEGIDYVGAATIDDAVAMLADGEVDAVVFDGPVLQYRLSLHKSSRLELVGETFSREGYAIAVAPGSPLRHEINVTLLELRENGSLDRLLEKWSISDG
ncbi:MAG: transporter substrate-binding domain-containing protein [Anaerolineae bacterium]